LGPRGLREQPTKFATQASNSLIIVNVSTRYTTKIQALKIALDGQPAQLVASKYREAFP